ncbi:MAG TPA: DUF308 domain-containing protein [Chitinophagaceae bacterium]|nr:DUF308 domain-containing protein [Chitinophagaceae bacterium]
MANTPFNTVINSIKYWYIPLIIGIILLLVGFYVFATPATSYLTLSVIFSLSFLASGILQVAFSIANRNQLYGWGWYLAGGILYTLCGLILISRPDISITTLPFVVGFFVMFKSVNILAWAFDLKNLGIIQWGNIAIVGILGIIFSFILIWNPVIAGLSLVSCTALAFIFAGIAAIMVSVKLKNIKNLPGRISEELKTRMQGVQ